MSIRFFQITNCRGRSRSTGNLFPAHCLLQLRIQDARYAESADNDVDHLVLIHGYAEVEDIRLLQDIDVIDGHWTERNNDSNHLTFREFTKKWSTHTWKNDLEFYSAVHPTGFARRTKAIYSGRRKPVPLEKGDLTPPPDCRQETYFGIYAFTTAEAAMNNFDGYVESLELCENRRLAFGPDQFVPDHNSGMGIRWKERYRKFAGSFSHPKKYS